jgi:hypothetical protein
MWGGGTSTPADCRQCRSGAWQRACPTSKLSASNIRPLNLGSGRSPTLGPYLAFLRSAPGFLSAATLDMPADASKAGKSNPRHAPRVRAIIGSRRDRWLVRVVPGSGVAQNSRGQRRTTPRGASDLCTDWLVRAARCGRAPRQPRGRARLAASGRALLRAQTDECQSRTCSRLLRTPRVWRSPPWQ